MVMRQPPSSGWTPPSTSLQAPGADLVEVGRQALAGGLAGAGGQEAGAGAGAGLVVDAGPAVAAGAGGAAADDEGAAKRTHRARVRAADFGPGFAEPLEGTVPPYPPRGAPSLAVGGGAIAVGQVLLTPDTRPYVTVLTP